MKPQLKAVLSKLFLGTSLLMALATAQGQTVTPVDGQSDNATVKYLGTQEDMVVFNVSYNNPDGSSTRTALPTKPFTDNSGFQRPTKTGSSFYSATVMMQMS